MLSCIFMILYNLQVPLKVRVCLRLMVHIHTCNTKGPKEIQVGWSLNGTDRPSIVCSSVKKPLMLQSNRVAEARSCIQTWYGCNLRLSWLEPVLQNSQNILVCSRKTPVKTYLYSIQWKMLCEQTPPLRTSIAAILDYIGT